MVAVSLEFAVGVGLIGVAGSRLCDYGGQIAVRTRLGQQRVGLFLLAVVTSLPELAIGLSSVGLADAADIAVGAILGSCVFNLAILVLLDVLLHHETVFVRASRDHLRAGLYGVVLVGVVVAAVVLDGPVRVPAVGSVGLYAPLLVALYLFAIRSVFESDPGGSDAPGASGRPPWLGFGVAAVAVVAAGVWLPFVGERLAAAMGVRETFVGTLFMAFATSLPETAVTVAALRIGAVDMAVANLLGSNLVNVLILVPEDLLYTSGPILDAVSPLHAVSGVSAILMTTVAVASLFRRSKPRTRRGPSWASVLLLAIYVANTWVVYRFDR
jgi:cation:H+ antiporter